MEKKTFDNGENRFTQIEGELGTDIIYSDKFKRIVETHPGLLGRIYKKLKDGYRDPKNLIEDDDEVAFNFDVVSSVNTNRLYAKAILKDSGDEFFIKVDNSEENPYREIVIMEYVKELLKDIPWVKFADYQFGYFTKNGWGFYVAKWNDVLTRSAFSIHDGLINDYGNDHSKVLKNIDDKIKEVSDILIPKGILMDHNISYDINTGDLYLYDLRMRDNEFTNLLKQRKEEKI